MEADEGEPMRSETMEGDDIASPTPESPDCASPMQQSPDQSDYVDIQTRSSAESPDTRSQSDGFGSSSNMSPIEEAMESENPNDKFGAVGSRSFSDTEANRAEADSDNEDSLSASVRTGDREDDDKSDNGQGRSDSPSEFTEEASQYSANVSNIGDDNSQLSTEKPYDTIIDDDEEDEDDFEERKSIGAYNSAADQDSKSQTAFIKSASMENVDSQDSMSDVNNSNFGAAESGNDNNVPFENTSSLPGTMEDSQSMDIKMVVSSPRSPPCVSSSSDVAEQTDQVDEDESVNRVASDATADDSANNEDDNSRDSLDLTVGNEEKVNDKEITQEGIVPVADENCGERLEFSQSDNLRQEEKVQDELSGEKSNENAFESDKIKCESVTNSDPSDREPVTSVVEGSATVKQDDAKTAETEEDQEDGESSGSSSGEEDVSEESSSSEEEEESEEEEGEAKIDDGAEDISEEEDEESEVEKKNKLSENVSSPKQTISASGSRNRNREPRKESEVSKNDDMAQAWESMASKSTSNDKIKTFVENREKERLERVRRRKERHEQQRLEELREKIELKGGRKMSSVPEVDNSDQEKLKSQTSLSEDHVELDYDEEVEGHDESKDKLDDSKEEEEGALKLQANSESDDGELEDDDDCEEGEIREPGTRKPFVKPTCRFYLRGHCTWGGNCRFLHPGVNDKGNYQLIERPGFNNGRRGPANFGGEEPFTEEPRSPSPEPPPPPPAQKEESAWERGLRHAKELMKKANERKVCETNFEEKKMNLSIEENPEYNKENNMEKERIIVKEPYYDKEVWSDDEYYDKTPMRQQQMRQEESHWHPGQYENFEVRWTQEPDYPPPQVPSQAQFPPVRMRERYPPRPHNMPPPQRQFSPPPYERYERPKEDRRPREKWRERSPTPPPESVPPVPSNKMKIRADDWHDPWRRSKSPKPNRSRSRGRRHSRRSHSYSSSFSSSSFSSGSRSRSRSSSFSSVSSQSRSRSRSSSVSSRSSKSPAGVGSPNKRRRPPPPGHPIEQRSMPNQHRFHDQPRSAVGYRGGRPTRSPDWRRPGGPMPMHGGRGGRRSGGGGGGGGGGYYQGPPDGGRNMGRPPMDRRPPMEMDRGRRMEKGPFPRKSPPMQKPRPFDRRASTDQKRDAPDKRVGPDQRRDIPDRRITTTDQRKDVTEKRTSTDPKREVPEKPRRHSRSSSISSRSGSRSRSRSSSSSSRASSGSSRSSHSRSSSSSSSGSADSDHLYRNISPKSQPTPSAGGMSSANQSHPDSRKLKDKTRLKPQQSDKKAPSPGVKGNQRGGNMSRQDPRGDYGKTAANTIPKAKDPLKVTGQKSNIKLTLIKPSDKSSSQSAAPAPGAKKRPAEATSTGPAAKRPALTTPVTKPDKPIKKPGDKPVASVLPTKPVIRPSASPVKAGPQTATTTAPVPAPVPVAKPKKSTVSRREELLKQLKAVEDAIARKRSKMS